MNSTRIATIIDFEAYLLMTMKLRISLSHQETQLEAKLAEHGLSVDDAKHIHDRVAASFNDDTSRFETMKNLLGIDDAGSTSLRYRSVFWPEFDFAAIAGEDGQLESARYCHARGSLSDACSPTELPIWRTDVSEFTNLFGPATLGYQSNSFEGRLPAYEEYEFEWHGTRYGAAFCWGLFISVAEFWD